MDPDRSEWLSAQHVEGYLERADGLAHRSEGDAALNEIVPLTAARLLDLGTGDGRTLARLLIDRPAAEGVALDFSPAMLQRAHARFGGNVQVEIVAHDLTLPLPALGPFDAVVSSFVIHHLDHGRKRALYAEIFALLAPGGVFCNLEHVSSPTPALHAQYLLAIGRSPDEEDPSNKLLDLETQLQWLRAIGFADVDCHWKWREFALFGGVRP